MTLEVRTHLSLDRQDEYHEALDRLPATADQRLLLCQRLRLGRSLRPGMGLSQAACASSARPSPKPVCWAPVGPWENYDWARLPGHDRKERSFVRVPEALTRLWSIAYGNKMTITEESREHWDYVYSVEELISPSRARPSTRRRTCLTSSRRTTCTTGTNPWPPSAWKRSWRCRTNGTSGTRRTTPPRRSRPRTTPSPECSSNIDQIKGLTGRDHPGGRQGHRLHRGRAAVRGLPGHPL